MTRAFLLLLSLDFIMSFFSDALSFMEDVHWQDSHVIAFPVNDLNSV